MFMWRVLVLLVALLSLSGCKHNDDGSAQGTPLPNTQPTLTKSPNYYKLKPNNGAEFAQSLKAYITSAYANTSYYRGEYGIGTNITGGILPPVAQSDFANTGAASGTSTATAGAANESSPNVSQTNLIEQGVDESDLIKSDGRYLFTVRNSNSFSVYEGGGAVGVVASNVSTKINPRTQNTVGAEIQVFALNHDIPEATSIKRLALSSPLRIDGIYLDFDEQLQRRQLLVIADSSSMVDGQYKQQTRVLSYNFADVEQPILDWNLSVEGSVIGSRFIDGQLLLLTRKQLELTTLLGITETPKDSNELAAVIDDLDASKVLPRTWLDTDEVTLTSLDDCIVPQQTNQQSYFDFGITNILSIPVFKPMDSSALCTLESTAAIYVSPTSLYLTKNDYLTDAGQGTLIHKIDIQNGALSYRASGRVAGTLGWNNTEFRMSELDGDFRIVTTQYEERYEAGAPFFWQGGNKTHHLYILRESENTQELLLLSQLPNEAQTTPIGKPGEQIYGVRFAGKYGYVVTFKKVDPLYVLNLADPEKPFIEGELELPGYSDYIHPVNDDILIGLGKDAIEENGVAWYQGLKLGVFDVSDKSKPVVIQEAVIGKRGSSSTALEDHHAFTFLELADNNKLRITFPVQVHDGEPTYYGGSVASAYYPWKYSGLKLFELDTTPGNIQLSDAGTLINSANLDTFSQPYQPRSLLVDDAVYYVNAGEVWASNWNAPLKVSSSINNDIVTGYLSIETISDSGSIKEPQYSVSITDAQSGERFFIGYDPTVNTFLLNNNVFNKLVTVTGHIVSVPGETYRRLEVADIKLELM